MVHRALLANAILGNKAKTIKYQNKNAGTT
jgi:hypothetical protein